MRIVLVIASLAAITISVSAQKIKSHTAPAKPTNDQKTALTENPLPPCNQISPCFVVTEPKATSKEEQAKADSLDTLTRRYMWATIIGVIGGLIGVGILIWQTWLVRTSATAALLSAQAVINAERAWMVGTEPRHSFEINMEKIQNILYGCSIKNVGKTPSRILEVGVTIRKTASLENVAPDPTLTYQKEEIRQFGGIVVVPDESLRIRTTQLSEELSWAENNAIADRKLFIYGYGFVRYLDVFDKPRESRFCHYYVVPAAGEPKDSAGFEPCIKVPSEYHKAT